MELLGKRALVTGASGFIGGRLSERLATEEGVQVRAMVRSSGKAKWLQKFPLEIVEADLTNRASLRQAVAGCDVVFHCAAVVQETGNPEAFYRTNVEGTENILKVSTEARVERFVHFSSVAVYGMNPPEGADERTPFQPCGNFYCDTKIEAEKMAWTFHREKKLPLIVIRPANVYGPRSNAWTLRPMKLVNSGQMFLIGGGTGLCNYVYIDNLIDATLAAVRRDSSVGETYLISDGAAVTWKEFFGYYARMAGKRRLRSVPVGIAKLLAFGSEVGAKISGRPPRVTRQAIGFLTRHAQFRIDKAVRDLDFHPAVSLTDGMRRTEEWLRQEGYLRE